MSDSDLRARNLTFGGRRALVTGGASGIGAAVVGLLREAGVQTLCVDRQRPTAATDFIEVDLSDGAQLRGALEGQLSEVSYLVNCAGIFEETGFDGVSRQHWARLLGVNLLAPYDLMEITRPFLRSGTNPAIVNVASLEAHMVLALTKPDPTPHYAASKAALVALTRQAARAMAQDGIRVNSVCPGFIGTPMASNLLGDIAEFPGPIAARVPKARYGSAEEVAQAVVFLLSDQASFITGSDLIVDGGLHLT